MYQQAYQPQLLLPTYGQAPTPPAPARPLGASSCRQRQALHLTRLAWQMRPCLRLSWRLFWHLVNTSSWSDQRLGPLYPDYHPLLEFHLFPSYLPISDWNTLSMQAGKREISILLLSTGFGLRSTKNLKVCRAQKCPGMMVTRDWGNMWSACMALG